MITPTLFNQAIKTSHSGCGDNCHLESSLDASVVKMLQGVLDNALNHPQFNDIGPSKLLCDGIHIGYRLAQLEAEHAKQKVN